MARVRLRGSSDWRSKMAIFCGRPSSETWKSSFVRPPTIAPVLSVTLTNRFTSFTSMRKVVSSCAARTSGASNAKQAMPLMRLRGMRSLRRVYRDAFGERFARGPHRAVDKSLLLPDGHCLLQGVDQPAAGVKGLRAVGRGHDDQDAGFSDLEPAQAVNQGHMAHAESGDRVPRQALHLLQGHLLVGLVV